MAYQARAVRPYPHQRRHVVVLPIDAMWSVLGSQNVWATTVASNWTAADIAIGFWITAPYDCTVYRIGWLNGSAAGGNTDVAIYDSDGVTRLVSTGSTACSGNSQYQFVDTTDQALTSGKDYFIASNHSTTTANEQRGYDIVLGVQLLAGVKVQAVGATALPDPFVPADPTTTNSVPVLALMLTNLGTS